MLIISKLQHGFVTSSEAIMVVVVGTYVEEYVETTILVGLIMCDV